MGAEPTKLLVVDDEPELSQMVAEYLMCHGFVVRIAGDGVQCDAELAAYVPDLLILDINLPGEDGFSVARRVRARSTVPILMLTAADTVVDRVAGLELGADDYVTKPFDLRELRARIRALLRRQGSGPAADVPVERAGIQRVRFGGAVLDLDARQLLGPDGAAIPLTAMEFDLLAVFARNPNRALSRERLLDLAHQRGTEVFDRSIDVRITRLRRKIERDPLHPELIKTLRGAGYIFVPAQG